MDLHVLAQPYRESAAGQTFITNALEDEKVTEVLILTAWVRESGMDLIAPALDVLRARGGTARLLFGVDLKGTSRQGVALAQKHFSDLYVVHDPSRTFHPKIYLALGARVGYALIGSNNLTAGGLWHNYESAMLATFNPRSEPAIAEGVKAYEKKLLDDDAICKRLTRRVVQRLEDEGHLADEASDRRHRVEDRASRRQQRGRGPAPLFTSSQVEKRSRPAPVRSTPARRRIPSRSRRQLATSIDSWWKELTVGDAQRPPDGHPTGNITLTNVPRDQDRATFFRRVLFGAERWRQSYDERRRRTELATIQADVQFDDDDLGRHELTVVYRPYRKERSRATTVLRWGDELLEELRRRNLAGRYLLIERADVGTYRIRVMEDEPV